MFRNQYDTDCITWSPAGRIHQIEYAMEAVKQGSACIGLRSNSFALVATLKRASSELSSYQKKIFKIDDNSTPQPFCRPPRPTAPGFPPSHRADAGLPALPAARRGPWASPMPRAPPWTRRRRRDARHWAGRRIDAALSVSPHQEACRCDWASCWHGGSVRASPAGYAASIQASGGTTAGVPLLLQDSAS